MMLVSPKKRLFTMAVFWGALMCVSTRSLASDLKRRGRWAFEGRAAVAQAKRAWTRPIASELKLHLLGNNQS